METLFQRHKQTAAFLFVYTREAHPADGWQMASNKTDGVVLDEPKVMSERHAVAQACCSRLNLSIPCAVDRMDNHVDELYAAWPERIFVIAPDGKIAYVGKPGPWGFKPEEAERALRRLERAQRKKSRAGSTPVADIRGSRTASDGWLWAQP